MGLSPDVVPDMTIPSHDELDRNLRRLAEEQEKLMAELAKTSANEVRHCFHKITISNFTRCLSRLWVLFGGQKVCVCALRQYRQFC